jgi:hypothetical protein
MSHFISAGNFSAIGEPFLLRNGNRSRRIERQELINRQRQWRNRKAMQRILQLLFLIAGLLTTGSSEGQNSGDANNDSVTRLIRLFEDDDYINFWGCGTDNAYTNGSRIDYYYQPAHRPHGLLGRYAPRAGLGSTDVYSWGLYEIMYTPDNLTKKTWQPNDYQYAGAIVASHTRYSYNPEKKYSIQTELVFGLIGPSAMGQAIQSGFHRLIHYTQPMGWSHQFRNDALLNVNITAEKQLIAAGRWLTLAGGARVSAGTMENGAAIYPLLLIGKMAPWFNGFFSHYTSPGEDRKGRKNWQGYFCLNPSCNFLHKTLCWKEASSRKTPILLPMVKRYLRKASIRRRGLRNCSPGFPRSRMDLSFLREGLDFL